MRDYEDKNIASTANTTKAVFNSSNNYVKKRLKTPTKDRTAYTIGNGI
jgi:hypothetical protein